MNTRPSTEHQQYACRMIATYTGIPLPLGWASDFYVCHAYIGRYYNNAKYIRDTRPIHRADWAPIAADRANYARDAERYAALHEAINNPSEETLKDLIARQFNAR